MILLTWVLGWLIPPMYRTIGSPVLRVPCSMKWARGSGFLEVLMSSMMLLITETLCLILLLKLVRLGALTTPRATFLGRLHPVVSGLAHLMVAPPVRTATFPLCLRLPELTI